MSIANVCRDKYHPSKDAMRLLKKLVRMKDFMHAMQAVMLVMQVCQVGADSPIADDVLAQTGQSISISPVREEEKEMANAVEVMSIVEIVMLICGMVYLVQQVVKMCTVCVTKCRKRNAVLVYIHPGRSVYHKTTCMWYSPPPKTCETKR